MAPKIPRSRGVTAGRLLATDALLVMGTAAVRAQTLPDRSGEAGASRHVGRLGDRRSAVAGVPGDASVYFVGAASGRIRRSKDGGHSWEPVLITDPLAQVGSGGGR